MTKFCFQSFSLPSCLFARLFFFCGECVLVSSKTWTLNVTSCAFIEYHHLEKTTKAIGIIILQGTDQMVHRIIFNTRELTSRRRFENDKPNKLQVTKMRRVPMSGTGLKEYQFASTMSKKSIVKLIYDTESTSQVSQSGQRQKYGHLPKLKCSKICICIMMPSSLSSSTVYCQPATKWRFPGIKVKIPYLLPQIQLRPILVSSIIMGFPISSNIYDVFTCISYICYWSQLVAHFYWWHYMYQQKHIH